MTQSLGNSVLAIFQISKPASIVDIKPPELLSSEKTAFCYQGIIVEWRFPGQRQEVPLDPHAIRTDRKQL